MKFQMSQASQQAASSVQDSWFWILAVQTATIMSFHETVKRSPKAACVCWQCRVGTYTRAARSYDSKHVVLVSSASICCG